jgi:hypothetical protein
MHRWQTIDGLGSCPASDRTRPKSLNGLGAPEMPRLQLPPRLGLPERQPGAETCQLPSVVTTAAAAAESPCVSPERSDRWFPHSAVQTRVLNPPKMRPKRYLRDEYKQLGHGCHPNCQVWTGFFVDGSDSTDRSLPGRVHCPRAPAYHHSPGVGGARHSTVGCHSGAVLALKYLDAN